MKVVGGSRIIEIEPCKEEHRLGVFGGVRRARPNWQFYSPFISSAERLPNGNNLDRTRGINGRFLPGPRPKAAIVWEYITPVIGPGGRCRPLPGQPPAEIELRLSSPGRPV